MLDINNMKRSDFYYDLPQELIAQTPVEPRNASIMMKINRQTGEVVHDHFYNLCNYLKKGDLLVLNDSKVLPARIYGEREDTGSFIEFLLVEQKENMVWEILCRPGKKAKTGTRFVFGGGKLKAEIIDVLEDGNRIARFECEENFFATLDEIGQMPLPPYITEKLKDKDRYQTVYAHELGSSAAPTAGLHFTEQQLEDLKAMGVTEKWEKDYPNAMKSWYKNWDVISPIFKFSADVRKVIYTTNAIESLNSGYRRLNKQRSVFPSDTALLKVLYLATHEIAKKWTIPLRNWGIVLGELEIMYLDRLS